MVNNNIAMSPDRVGFCVRLGLFFNADGVNHSKSESELFSFHFFLPVSSFVKNEFTDQTSSTTFDYCSTPFECDADHDVTVTHCSEEFYNQTKYMVNSI